MNFILESPRLLLREFDVSDAPFLFALNEDPVVLKYTGDSPFENENGAREFLENYNPYAAYGFGRWAVLLKKTNQYLGWCGLKKKENGQVDIGFRFFRKFWGKGYATESAQASLIYGFEFCDLESIIGRAMPENKASIRILEKLNMQFWKSETSLDFEGALTYRITQSQFRLNRPMLPIKFLNS